MIFQTLKQNYVDGLIETEAFLVRSINETPFTLRSGKQSCMFLDHSKVTSSAKAYKSFIDVMQYLVHETYGSKKYVLCNIDSKISAQMVGSVAYNLDLPQIIYKSQALTSIEKGPMRQMTGNPEWNLPVALLDDVATGRDGTAKDVGDLIKKAFPKIKDIQIFVGFIREVQKTTYKMNYVITRDELIDIVWKKLTSGQQKAIEKERKI